MLWPVPGNGEVVSRGRIRYSSPARFHPGEIHHARIQRQQQVIAPPVQRKILHLLFPYQAGDVSRRGAHDGRIPSHPHFRCHRAYFQFQIDACFLSHDQADPAPDRFLKARFSNCHFVLPHSQPNNLIPPCTISCRASLCSCLCVLRRHRRRRNRRPRWVGDGAFDARRHLGASRRQATQHQEDEGERSQTAPCPIGPACATKSAYKRIWSNCE